MTVGELISFLQTQPEDLQVAYIRYSEHALLNVDDIDITEACIPRPDGWIHHMRPDMPSQMYLMLPGN